MSIRGMLVALGLGLAGFEAQAIVPPNAPKEAPQVRLGGVNARVWASSTLKSKVPGRYAARNAFDGKRATAWIEGAPEIGDDESLHVRFEVPVLLSGFVLHPGYTKSLKTLRENQIPGMIRVWDEQDRRAGTFDFYFQSEERPAADGSLRCEHLSKNPINLAPKLVVLITPVDLQYVKLEFSAPARGHTAKYEDMAVSEWTPIIDRDDPTFTPTPLEGTLEKVFELLSLVNARGKLEPQALAPGFTAPDLFALSLPDVPAWAQEELRTEMGQLKMAPAQAPLANLARFLQGQFVHHAVTIQPLASGARLHGDPFILQRKTSEAPTKVETIYVFPILTLDKEARVKQVELRTSGLSGAHCESTLPHD